MDEKITYEDAIKRLETMAVEMENGNVPIDQLATKLREAKELLSFCRDRLTKAQAEVKELGV